MKTNYTKYGHPWLGSVLVWWWWLGVAEGIREGFLEKEMWELKPEVWEALTSWRVGGSMFQVEIIFSSCSAFSGNHPDGRTGCHSPHTSLPAFLSQFTLLSPLLPPEVWRMQTGEVAAQRVRERGGPEVAEEVTGPRVWSCMSEGVPAFEHTCDYLNVVSSCVSALVLKVWSPDHKHQHPLGAGPSNLL